MSGCPSTYRSAGFTLIELMIVLAIVAVLAGWGIPSYREHVARVHRASAVAALYRAAQYLEALEGVPPSALPTTLRKRRRTGARSIVWRSGGRTATIRP